MGRLLLGLLAGVALTLLVQGQIWGDHWRYMGQLDGKGEVFAWVEREFGVKEAGAREIPAASALSLKASLLVVVEVNGVKTVRVVP